MVYAYLTDGLDQERREEFDRMLEQGKDETTKARRERSAVSAAMRFAR